MTSKFSRRDFLKLSGLGLGALAFDSLNLPEPMQFPAAERLGRVLFAVDVKSQPNFDAPTVTQLYEDTVVEWNRETIASYVSPNVINQRWVETPQGFVYSPYLQPVKYLPNTPLAALPAGALGFWADVTVPFVDLIIDNPPIRSPWARTMLSERGVNPRLYYGQVVWIDAIKVENGITYYRFNEDVPHGYGYGDAFWADASAFRLITDEEVAPIAPEVDPAEKKIVINITYQTLSCIERNREVFFCRASTGLLMEQVGKVEYETPVGDMYVFWKIYSKSMGANSSENAAGYDTPAVPWCTFIATGGVAIHGAFWHNNFGTPRSHGCVNVLPQDAKWIFRWATPYVSLQQSEIRYTDWQEALKSGTHVTTVKRK
jgi:hypothetical protein